MSPEHTVAFNCVCRTPNSAPSGVESICASGRMPGSRVLVAAAHGADSASARASSSDMEQSSPANHQIPTTGPGSSPESGAPALKVLDLSWEAAYEKPVKYALAAQPPGPGYIGVAMHMNDEHWRFLPRRSDSRRQHMPSSVTFTPLLAATCMEDHRRINVIARVASIEAIQTDRLAAHWPMKARASPDSKKELLVRIFAKDGHLYKDGHARKYVAKDAIVIILNAYVVESVVCCVGDSSLFVARTSSPALHALMYIHEFVPDYAYYDW